MDEADEGISVTEIGLATLVPNKDGIRVVMNEAVQSTGVIENIDTSENMTVPSTEGDIEIIDLTANDITMTENFVAIPGRSTDGINEIKDQVDEVKIENREVTSIPRPEDIGEIMDQESEGFNVIENLVATPEQITEGVSEPSDQLTADANVIENSKATPVSGIEVFTKIMDLDEVSVTKSFVATFGSNPKRINEIMEQATEGISVIENVEAVPLPSTEERSEISNKIAESFEVIENLKITPVSGAEVFTKIMDLDEVSVTESLVATFVSNTKRINEIMEQATEGISVIENVEAIPLSSTKEISEISNKIAESFEVIENLKITPVSGAEVFTKIMELDKVSVTESLVATFGSNPKIINETMEQATDCISVIGNIEAMPRPNTERINEISDKIAESFDVIKNLKATPVTGTEVSTKTVDLHDISVTETLVDTSGSNPKRINEILKQTTEDISVIENIEFMLLPNTERISEISDKIIESFDVIENSEAISSSSTSVNQKLVPNENTTNTVFDKETRNMANEVETEATTIINGQAKNLKTVHGCEKKGRKRKISHPSISEMVMDSIKSLKKSSGVSFEDIKSHMEENYQVTVKALLKYHVNNFLQKWVENGILEKVDEADMGARFKIKESENNCIKQAKKLKMN